MAKFSFAHDGSFLRVEKEDQVQMENAAQHLASQEFEVIRFIDTEPTSFEEKAYPALSDDEVALRYPNAKSCITTWYIHEGNFKEILHYIFFKEENFIRELFSQFRWWEVRMCTKNPQNTNGTVMDGELLGFFFLPPAFSQKVSLNKRLQDFVKNVYLSPIYSTARNKKFYEAKAWIQDSIVWVKIPTQCVRDACLAEGTFAWFEIAFQFNRWLFPVLHAHADTMNFEFKTRSPQIFERRGGLHLERSWRMVGASIFDGPTAFSDELYQLFREYASYY